MGDSGDDLSRLTFSGPGLTLVTGPNGSGKSTAARALGARVAGSWLLSAESQQAFYEAQLAADEGNFKQGVDTSITVRELLGERGPQPSALRGVSARVAVGATLPAALHRRGAQGPAARGRAARALAADPRRSVRRARPQPPARSWPRPSCTWRSSCPCWWSGRSAPASCRLRPQSLREVAVVVERRLIFRGTPQAFLARASDHPHPPNAAARAAG